MHRAVGDCEVSIVDIEEHVDILEASEILEKQEVGSALIYKVCHPTHGKMVMFVPSYGGAAHVSL